MLSMKHCSKLCCVLGLGLGYLYGTTTISSIQIPNQEFSSHCFEPTNPILRYLRRANTPMRKKIIASMMNVSKLPGIFDVEKARNSQSPVKKNAIIVT